MYIDFDILTYNILIFCCSIKRMKLSKKIKNLYENTK